MKRSALRRTKGLNPTPLAKVNRKRKAKDWHKHFGSVSRVLAVNALGCAVCREGPSENAHVRSRAAGGTWRDVVPLCWWHHREQHAIGWETFRRRYPDRDFDALAARLAVELRP